MDVGLMLFGMKNDFRQVLAEMALDYINPVGAIPFGRDELALLAGLID